MKEAEENKETCIHAGGFLEDNLLRSSSDVSAHQSLWLIQQNMCGSQKNMFFYGIIFGATLPEILTVVGAGGGGGA